MNRMRKTISIIQLPFPSLSYFPVPTYFSSLENWYRRNVSVTCTVPENGIWEIPMWISWINAFTKMAISDLNLNIDVDIIDLNKVNYSFADIKKYLVDKPFADLYFFSPLIQNYSLTIEVSKFLRSNGAKVAVGGATTSSLSDINFDYIFKDRIEYDYGVFLDIIANLFSIKNENIQFSYEKFSQYLSYDWAKNYYRELIYLRVFTFHGCPLSCLFCADRLSGKMPIPEGVIEKEIFELHYNFPSNDVLYIGDLTFGIHKAAFDQLERILIKIKRKFNKTYKLIIQTNPTLITQDFIDNCKRINVVLIELGIESGNSDAVIRMSKKRPSEKWLENKLQLLIDNKLSVAGNIIIGLPYDTAEDYKKTMNFIIKWKGNIWFNVYGFVPYPNTPLYQQLNADNKIINWNFDDWCEGKELVFEPYFITRKEVSNILEETIRIATGEDLR